MSKGDRSLVLDAKYRDLWAWALPRDMFYQLSLYALAQPRPGTATILYPTPHEEAVDAVLELREPSTGAACGRVVLRPVILPRLLVAVESARERTCLAGAWTRELVTVEAM